ncbi:MAG: 4-phosphopantetheinyl transferase family protein [Desulfomonile tiedjei]|nr:4-phosphopantetheinyl transferase family protein [Desulfomonile tiedjei]
MESAKRGKSGATVSSDSVAELRLGQPEVVRDLQVRSALVGDHPVLYARATLSCRQKRDASLRRTLQEQLAKLLWTRSASSSYEGTSSHGITHDVRIVRTILNRPLLRVSDRRCASVSFSWTTGVLWAALSDEGTGVGIDASEAAEFEGPYPYERVFGEPEWGAWFTGGRETYPETAALVWSGKEAVVKAIGSGFHLIAPREVEIVPCDTQRDQIRCRAGFSNRVLERFPELRRARTCIMSFKESRAWLSIALIEVHIEGMGG